MISGNDEKAQPVAISGDKNTVRNNVFQNYSPSIAGSGNSLEQNLFIYPPPTEAEQLRQAKLVAISAAHVFIGRIYDLVHPDGGRAHDAFPPIEFMNDQLASVGLPWRVKVGGVAGSIEVVAP